MELNRHPMGHNRIEYEQRSDEKKEVYYCKHKTLITTERYFTKNESKLNSYLMQSITKVLTKTGAGLILNNCFCILNKYEIFV